MDLVNLIGGIASLSLSVIAMWLSLYFYNKSKETEKDTAEALAAIKAQTETLQKIIGRQTDRLTKFATESNPNNFIEVVSILKEISTNIPNKVDLPHDKGEVEQLTQETINGYIGMYFYTAYANFWAQGFLPKMTDYDDSLEFHRAIRDAIDGSHKDFLLLQGIIKNVHVTRIKASPLYHLYEKTETFWKNLVKDSVQVFKSREESPPAD